jgi:hypothetical protein
MNSCQLTTSITALANVIAGNLSIEETTLFAAILVQLGDTLATIATQKAVCETIEDRGKN